MQIGHHGGKCCGIKHLFYFQPLSQANQEYDYSDEQRDRYLEWLRKYKATPAPERYELPAVQYPEYVKNESGETVQQAFERQMAELRPGLLKEVVLCDYQITKDVVALLKKFGFRLVSRFVNPNSENVCNVFHSSAAFLGEEPDWWKEEK